MNWKKLLETGEAILGRSYQEAVNLDRYEEWWSDLAKELLIKLQKNQEAAAEALHVLEIERQGDYFLKMVDCNNAVIWLRGIVEEK